MDGIVIPDMDVYRHYFAGPTPFGFLKVDSVRFCCFFCLCAPHSKEQFVLSTIFIFFFPPRGPVPLFLEPFSQSMI